MAWCIPGTGNIPLLSWSQAALFLIAGFTHFSTNYRGHHFHRLVLCPGSQNIVPWLDMLMC